MKIWLSKNSEIPVREQIVTQIALGIVSGDLRVGEKLPSTREIARRFGVHSNTVSSAYQKLSEQNLIEFKKGSGFFVSETKTS
ncbi:MAG: GntR family transcriptional regulator, partial [Pyrinomonadaceae bacterium]